MSIPDKPLLVLPEYPRPQLCRDSYKNLNGIWEYAITGSLTEPNVYDGEIVVPYSPESRLSGVCKTLKPHEYLFYKTSFTLFDDFVKDRVIINFGAVDRHAVLFINGKEICRHSGGYTPFSADITDALFETGKENTLVLRVKDETDSADTGGRGKQSLEAGGIWYNPQSGIWQTVWLESVPENYIKKLRITPDFDTGTVTIHATSDTKATCKLEFDGRTYGFASNGSVNITLKDFTPWTPENPHLYYFTVKMGNDIVESYFGMRKISVEKDENGYPRLCLNNKPYFQCGLLDQGYFYQGLYTPENDTDLVNDILLAKSFGFNMIRKHAKVESMRWYYHCDRLGMLVWQDMVNGGEKYKFSQITLPLFSKQNKKDDNYSAFSRSVPMGRAAYISEMCETVNTLYNSPSVVVWTAFNEGWGQFDSKKICERIHTLDQTRLIDAASGWHDNGAGDIYSKHIYFKKAKNCRDKLGRPYVISEFGGYALNLDNNGKKPFGYKLCKDFEGLTSAVEKLFADTIPMRDRGLCAFVYTQLSDVESELNGLVTNDRKKIKLDTKRISAVLEKIKENNYDS